jgi:hypothetical protein
VCALQANAPERLPEQFIALPAMKFMQEIFEIARRRLLEALQPKKSCNFIVVKFVHCSEG